MSEAGARLFPATRTTVAGVRLSQEKPGLGALDLRRWFNDRRLRRQLGLSRRGSPARSRRRLRAAVGQRSRRRVRRRAGGSLMPPGPRRPAQLLTSIARDTQMHPTHKWVVGAIV